MKPAIQLSAQRNNSVIRLLSGGIFVVMMITLAALGQQSGALRIERATNGIQVVQGAFTNQGALFVLGSSRLNDVFTAPSLIWATNSPLTNDIRFSAADSMSTGTNGFFSSLFISGGSVQDFDFPPEADAESKWPTSFLVVQTDPATIQAGVAVTVRLQIVDGQGNATAYSGDAELAVIDPVAGTSLSQVTINPPSIRLTNGWSTTVVTITTTNALAGYTIGLRLNTNSSWLATLDPNAAGPGNILVPPALQLGLTTVITPYNLPSILASLPPTYADPDQTWSFPFSSGSPFKLAGTYGENRGNCYSKLHKGIDIVPTTINVQVYPSRAGKVSHIGNLGVMGRYVVIDHGDGWYSRYLHIGTPLVNTGAIVTRTTALASSLYNWAHPHLHFEVRFKQGFSGYVQGEPFPGESQDPLQTPGIFIFPKSPQYIFSLQRFGLTGAHPRNTVFDESRTTIVQQNPAASLYVFLRLREPENIDDRLGCRWVTLIPHETLNCNNDCPTITPISEPELKRLSVDSTAPYSNRGFARYGAPCGVENRNLYFPYWFAWDTSAYSGDAIGARTFYIQAANYRGNYANLQFRFGPTIVSLNSSYNYIDPVTGHMQVFLVGFQPYLGHSSDAPEATQPDTYQLNLSGAGAWTINNTKQVYTPLITSQQNVQYYQLVRRVRDRTAFSVKVQSMICPNIAHAVPKTLSALGPLSALVFTQLYVNGSLVIDSPGGFNGHNGVMLGDHIKMVGYPYWYRSTAPSGEPTRGPIDGAVITLRKIRQHSLPDEDLGSVISAPDGTIEVNFDVTQSDFYGSNLDATFNIFSNYSGSAGEFNACSSSPFFGAHRPP